jgi:hypothetical protein
MSSKQPSSSKKNVKAIMLLLSIFSISAGYMAATQPSGAGWRYFSYHPMLMTIGFVLCMGNAALIKKLGGYSNTKIHVRKSIVTYLHPLSKKVNWSSKCSLLPIFRLHYWSI